MFRKCKVNVVASKGVFNYNEITKLKEYFIMKLTDKLVKLRKTNGWSQEDLAEKLNVSRQAISRWESGTSQPDASNVLNLSKLFGVTADYLLNDEYDSDFDVPVVRQAKSDATRPDSSVPITSISWAAVSPSTLATVRSCPFSVSAASR